ncbi:MAG: GGDEF domain-containing protein [Paracoccaceae bacterium]
MSDTWSNVRFDRAALDLLMPMSIIISPTGHIGSVGPTLAKLRPDEDLVGRRFLEVFLITRPRRKIVKYLDLRAIIGSKLKLQFRDGRTVQMKGVIAADAETGGLLVNLSFGFQLIDAVREFGLTNGDFAETELAIEMLYLIEAKTALMQESKNLNRRLRGAHVVLEKQALTDDLTKLNNRRAMDQVLRKLVTSSVPFGLMYVDLDYFKAVNDTFGHAAGDHVLQIAAKILTSETRECDTVARVGGDEFVLIFEGLVDEKRLLNIASRIVKKLEVPVKIEDKNCCISGSIGFTTSTFYTVPDVDQMHSDVDVALYASKHKGRACTTVVTRILLDPKADQGPVLATSTRNSVSN